MLGFLGLIGMPTSIIFSSELTFLIAAARRSPGAAVAVDRRAGHRGGRRAAPRVRHALRTRRRATAGRAPAAAAEPFTITHAVVAVELALLFAGGIFFLSTPGFEWAASIARDFTVAPMSVDLWLASAKTSGRDVRTSPEGRSVVRLPAARVHAGRGRPARPARACRSTSCSPPTTAREGRRVRRPRRARRRPGPSLAGDRRGPARPTRRASPR